MRLAAYLLSGLVAAEHVAFLVLEMFLWTKPRGRRISGLSEEEAEQTAVLAANQGLYNGFLALGLVYGLLESDPGTSSAFLFFFLACAAAAGCYGGWSASRRIYAIQAAPALLALAFAVAAL